MNHKCTATLYKTYMDLCVLVFHDLGGGMLCRLMVGVSGGGYLVVGLCLFCVIWLRVLFGVMVVLGCFWRLCIGLVFFVWWCADIGSGIGFV